MKKIAADENYRMFKKAAANQRITTVEQLEEYVNDMLRLYSGSIKDLSAAVMELKRQNPSKKIQSIETKIGVIEQALKQKKIN